MIDLSVSVWLLFLPIHNGMTQAPATFLTAENCQKVAKELASSDLHLWGARKPLCIQARIYK